MLDRLEAMPLIDHHCHGVLPRDLERAEFERYLTEAATVTPLGGSMFDTQAGFALRRWCAPVLDLEPHAAPDDYLARRTELGAAEVNRRFLAAAGLAALCVDTGYIPEPLLEPAELGRLADAPAYEIVRLEQAARTAVGAKSIAAYRAGLELAGERPGEAEITAAAGRLLRADGPPRVCDEVLHRFLIWCAADLGLPVQFHVGYGDADTDLRRGDPLLLTGLLRALAPTGTPVLLLHNYPFHRNAGYLAQVFPNVFVDAGLATHNLGQRAPALIAELLELAPFGKVLYSSDAFGLAEFFHLGALLFRRGLARLLAEGVAEGAWAERDAVRVAGMITAGNARRIYRLRS
ncbi:amidohydrolase family protein [Actinomadura macrotermitis]|uniref:Amidohydrolase-related domain-containing protein n=1 Tax=Actinomadura macrotermitis TaxID=2585200 RepID=A0A7K0C7E0_9ACTN|nr:hypothetical protein [Actinomadura macrotermitis]